MGHYQKNKTRQRKSGEEMLVELRVSRPELQQMVKEGLHGLAMEIGMEVATALLADEVEGYCGPTRKRNANREAYRHGSQRGWIAIGGMKAAIERPQVDPRHSASRSVGGGCDF